MPNKLLVATVPLTARRFSDKLVNCKNDTAERLTSLREVLAKLDELADIMSDMLEQQQGIEVRHVIHENAHPSLHGPRRLIMKCIWHLFKLILPPLSTFT